MAYESRLAVSFGWDRVPPRALWDWAWPVGAPAPAGVPAGLEAATVAVGLDLLGSPEVRGRFPGLSWSYHGADRILGVLDLTSFCSVPDGVASLVTAVVADRVQDQLTGYEFIQWPMCPSHHHPMRPSVVDELAWWTCPATGRPVHRVGSLPREGGST
jgi:hypothetical protein